MIQDTKRENVGGQTIENRPVSRRRACRILVPLLLVSVWLVSSCAGTAPQPRLIPFPEAARSIRSEGGITEYRAALAAVLSVTERELRFPNLRGSLRLYPDHTSLEAALLGEGYDALYARQVADTLDGVGRPSAVLANEAVLRWRSWPERTSFLAHELTHVAEYELAGGRRGNLDQWLREGLAEWVSSHVMETLRLGSLADRRLAAVANLRTALRRRRLPSFDELLTARAWREFSGSQPRNVMYDEAFLAADLLIARHGLAAALDYFRLFSSSDDHLANFSQAFGEERSNFQGEFSAYLAQVLR
jgi:hypothetical protein